LVFFVTWLFIGFIAQLVNGSIGMGYGVSSTTFLLSLGIYPVIVSASVHTAQIFTALVSGGAHLRLGNVKRDIILPLIAFGILGGVIGAYGCVVMPTISLKVMVGGILLAMGCIILYQFTFGRVIRYNTKIKSSKMLPALGFFAAFLDAMVGGGRGPIATSALILNKVEPSKVVGSVNFVRLFVTIAITSTFFTLLGPGGFNWGIVTALIIGGFISAPIAALISKKLPHRRLGQLAGIGVILLSTYTLFRVF
jgi:hypothetical protein